MQVVFVFLFQHPCFTCTCYDWFHHGTFYKLNISFLSNILTSNDIAFLKLYSYIEFEFSIVLKSNFKNIFVESHLVFVRFKEEYFGLILWVVISRSPLKRNFWNVRVYWIGMSQHNLHSCNKG